MLLIAKAPLSGLAKSRLLDGGRFDQAYVARIAEAFLRDTIDLCTRVPDSRFVIAFSPDEAEEWFRAAAPSATLARQAPGDLGSRLSGAFDRAFELGAERAVLICSDTPHLPQSRIAEAFDALATNDCVIGPASDGGYYLLGLRRPDPRLFTGIAWSTSSVYAETVALARALSMRTVTLATESDVDVEEDLRRLAREVVATPERCPRTARVLREAFPPESFDDERPGPGGAS